MKVYVLNKAFQSTLTGQTWHPTGNRGGGEAPMKPTEICFLSECSRANWRSSWMNAPLPNEFVRDEWNASVGYSAESSCTHRAVAHVGTRSHLPLTPLGRGPQVASRIVPSGVATTLETGRSRR